MIDLSSGGLKLTKEEAFALLGLCLTSPNRLDSTSENALIKLAKFCREQSNSIDIEKHKAESLAIRA